MQNFNLFDELNDDQTVPAAAPADDLGRNWMNVDVADKSSYQYFMRVDPDMRDFLGPIEAVDDALTGRRMRKRWAKIAMVRGARDENLKEVDVYLDPFPHIRIDNAKDLQGWYSSKGDGGLHGQRDRPCETDAVLTQPYGGWCNVGCQFCYINSGSRGYRGSGLVTVPLDYGKHVRKQLTAMQFAAAGYFSSFTDPFLPLEEYYHNTQAGAEAFVAAGLPIFFLSRLRYPDWAIDLLKKNPYSYAQKSINAPDQETWKKLSPGAISLPENFEQIRVLRKAGIYVSIQVNPVIPGVVSHEKVEQLFVLLAEAGANHVIVKFVEANHPWAAALVERIGKKFPGKPVDRLRELFTENSCGGQKTVAEWYRREGHTRYQKLATKLGMTYSLCYEYTKVRGTGRWISMGPEFLTADQCHGHRVPMFAKRDGAFAPIEVCPTHGCLRCADAHDEGEPPCGSETLGSAQAWKMSDYRKDPNVKLFGFKNR
jgi:DNA repair photolyase